MDRCHFGFVESGYPHPHGGGGGAGTYVQIIGRELVDQGHRVSVVTAPCPQCEQVWDDGGVKVYRPNKGTPFHWYLSKLALVGKLSLATRYLENGWRIFRFLEELHQKDPFDLVEFTEGGDFWHAWRASFPYLVHLHGSRYTFLCQSGRAAKYSDWLHRWLQLQFIRNADHVVAPCQAILKIVEQENRDAFPHKTVIPYPLDKSLLQSSDRIKKDKAKSPLILFAARNDPVKGGDVLLKAVPLVHRAIPHARFQMFGFEPNGIPVPEQVDWFSFVPKLQLLQHYRRADVCVIPSRWDNSPNTVYEAMVAGKAVVASRVGGIPELVEERRTGLLVPPGDAAALADSILELLQDQSGRERMGQRGNVRIRKLADLKSNVDQRLEIYGESIELYRSSK